MDKMELDMHKNVLVTELHTQIDEITRIADEATALSKVFFKHLPKVRIYNARKSDLKQLLRDFGYQGKEMESMIHRPNNADSYISDTGARVWVRHQCQYLLYAEDSELNEELQVTLTLDETSSSTAYILKDIQYRNFYGNVTTMTPAEIDKLTFSQKLEALREFRNQCMSRISNIEYRIRSIQAVDLAGTSNSTLESSLAALKASQQ